MNLIPLSAGSVVLLIVFVSSDSSWINFKEKFPGINEATIGPYFVLISSVALTLAIQKTFTAASEGERETFPVAGLQIASILSLLSAFIYSFSFINLNFSIQYFLLLQLLTFLIFYGGAQFVGDLKKMDRSSSSRRVKKLQIELDLKKLLLDIKQRHIGEHATHHIDDLLLYLKDQNRSTDLEIINNLKRLCELLQDEKQSASEAKRLKLIIHLMEQE